MATPMKTVAPSISILVPGARYSRRAPSVAAALTIGVCFGFLVAGAFPPPAGAEVAPKNVVATHRLVPVNFELESASQEARREADWVVDSGDNRSLPFVIIDKTEAKVFVFYSNGRLRGAARALLGLTRGDTSVPGIGNRMLSSIRPDERTTPAGRFVASLGRDLHGEEVLWVDYDGGVALHRIITSNFKEHRAQRLASSTSLDKRITYGCINVSVDFYERVISPAFTGTNGIVYVLPEMN